MTEEKLREAYNIYTDCWKFYKKYHEPVNTDIFWTAAMQDLRSIAKRHDDNQFCIDLLMRTLAELERKILVKPT